MASYQSRTRDPLFDSKTQAALERRSKELLGLVLLGIGFAAALMLATYTPDDPSWLNATSRPAQNALGRLGASLASPLFFIVGWGAWGVPVAFAALGMRFVLHQGADRMTRRVIFVPIAIALLSTYASTHLPTATWTQSFGMGGNFGDTALGAILGILSVTGPVGMKLTALALMAATVAMWLFVLGFSQAELKALGLWMLRGTVRCYAGLLGAAARGRQGVGRGVSMAASSYRDRAARQEEIAGVSGAEIEDPVAGRAPRVGLPRLFARRGAEPEPLADLDPVFEDDDARIATRIADAVKSRMRAGGATPQPLVARTEPPLRRTRPAEIEAEHQARLFPEPEEEMLVDEAEPFLEEPEAASPDPDIAAPTPRATPNFAAQKERKPVAARPAPQREAAPRKTGASEGAYDYPPLDLLASPDTVTRYHLGDEALEENARTLESVLEDYGVKGEIVSVRPGPVVTMYELEPAPGLKASRVIGLADDIARSMSALSARVSTVPGRSVIGIELPNDNREMCVLREILTARSYGDAKLQLPLALGKDIGGDPVVANLAKMPHLLIAGTTGSGKSVAINTMILSLLYRLTPEECRLIMIDPKMLELSVYDGIPHLLSPVVTDPKKAVVALKWVVGEMEDRYRKMSKMGVRNIEGYNSRVRDALSKNEMFERTVQTGFDDETGDPIFETEEMQPELLPFIVVVVDEMADLMMVAGKEIEACIQRLAQMARASGIHLIMATQRPSVDVITGTIKANFPTRISFAVTSKIDSRTILGEQGAEQLLGMGDMLYMAGGSKITRVHGPFCSDEEVEDVVRHLKSFGPPEYLSGVVEGPDEEKGSDIDAVLGLGNSGSDGEDALYDQAVAIAIRDRKCSTSYIQRKLAIGYNKAARLVEQMEDQGVVSSANHVGKREVLVPEPQ
ncbi:DNA translocase FtsK [Palleronia aestuarii]|uniref:DNA translocase FtsK n=1 Tax=Palleronia aestuarii TaxID=568105 RepID=A0A2W7NF56_9RHOB|nr:DNA translocase FtsK [Palleronia aestuarii]PZX18838.1 DNA translocase FtsK [Palleronia aestuarii]